jgi:hypothetical protein
VLEIQKWADNIKAVQDENTKLAIIAANNHYAGFGPGTVNIFRSILGLPEPTWRKEKKNKSSYNKSNIRPMTRINVHVLQRKQDAR